MTAFWDWALEAYARPGAAEACLALQDRHGQNVPLVLWVVWGARQGLGTDLQRGAAVARAWEEAAVGPLRAVRRALKAELPGIDEAAREAFRARIKSVELEGERVLMAALEALAGRGEASSQPPAQRLSAAARAYGAPAGPEVFAGLLARL